MSRIPAETWTVNSTLTPQDLESTWQAYRVSRDTASRNTLMEHYLPGVKYYCQWYHDRLPSEVQLDDVIAAGLDGLRRAIAGFNPDLGVRFESYLSTRMRGAIRDYLRNIDSVPRHMRSRTNHLKHCRDELTSSLHRAPSDGDMAEYMGVTTDDFSRLTSEASAAHTISLSGGTSTGVESFRVADTLADTRTEDPSAPVCRADIKQFVVRGLTTQERRILLLYYYEQCTMQEIAEILGVTESRVSQVHRGMIDRLREDLAERRDELAI
jgi:RNA polymerase sigma factor FliA